MPSGTLREDGVFEMDDVPAPDHEGETIRVYLDDPHGPPPALQAQVEAEQEATAKPEAPAPPLFAGSPPRRPPVPDRAFAPRAAVTPCACIRAGICVCLASDRCGCTGPDGMQGAHERAAAGAARDAQRALNTGPDAVGGAHESWSSRGGGARSSRELVRGALEEDWAPSALHAWPAEDANGHGRDRDMERRPSFLTFSDNDCAPQHPNSESSERSSSFEQIPLTPRATAGPRPPGQPRPPPDTPMEQQPRPAGSHGRFTRGWPGAGQHTSEDDRKDLPSVRSLQDAGEPQYVDWPHIANFGISPIGPANGNWPRGIGVVPPMARLRGGGGPELKAKMMVHCDEESNAEDVDVTSDASRTHPCPFEALQPLCANCPRGGGKRAAATDPREHGKQGGRRANQQKKVRVDSGTVPGGGDRARDKHHQGQDFPPRKERHPPRPPPGDPPWPYWVCHCWDFLDRCFCGDACGCPPMCCPKAAKSRKVLARPAGKDSAADAGGDDAGEGPSSAAPPASGDDAGEGPSSAAAPPSGDSEGEQGEQGAPASESGHSSSDDWTEDWTDASDSRDEASATLLQASASANQVGAGGRVGAGSRSRQRILLVQRMRSARRLANGVIVIPYVRRQVRVHDFMIVRQRLLEWLGL